MPHVISSLPSSFIILTRSESGNTLNYLMPSRLLLIPII